MRPKLSGEEATAFWASEVVRMILTQTANNDWPTSGLIQALLDLLQLRFKLLVLDSQPPVRVLQESLEVLDTLIPSKQLALRDTCLLLQGRVLVYELQAQEELSAFTV